MNRPRLVVTLPAGIAGRDARAFAARARALGADLLELRDDLVDPAALDGNVLASELPLLLAARGGLGFPASWPAALRDHPLGGHAGASVVSLHSAAPLAPDQALATWNAAALGPEVLIKHVEPLGDDPTTWMRLLTTQQRLRGRFGDRVTVLATGAWALPFRALLAAHNALEFVAVAAETASAAGQRLLEDAARSGHSDAPRRALIGSHIAHARSPRVHEQPFDRWDVPQDAPVGALIDAVRAHYVGFAVTAPFKRVLAAHVGSSLPAVNTLVRSATGWDAFNTDVDGARAALDRARMTELTVLGDGGAAAPLRLGARGAVRVLRAADAGGRHVGGDVAWTWPAHVEPPAGLSLAGARVLVIAYGPPARVVASRIRALGGEPVLAGATWFVAQARVQRELWRRAT
ncbi:MAG: shikimate dehydrogenase [Deltaproteobacteria bacterium]|nr:shikimate dehydrogenase [Deltaproteobacteria bacterium]